MSKSVIRLLAVGNSFSDDAFHYLHDLAAADGVELRAVNLYIGGCNLETHWRNACSGEKLYLYMENGVSTGRYVSIAETLEEGPWDYIMTQQASHDSGWMDTYEPFMGILVETFRREAPGARILLQETWAYEHTSTHNGFLRYHRSQQEMYEKLRRCYYAMAEKYQLEVIPCGDLIQTARALPAFDTRAGGQTLCRDGFHMNLYGRYLLACAWLKKLCGVSVSNNPFVPESGCGVDVVDETLLQLIRDTVDKE